MEIVKIDVMFRRDKANEVLAVFPYDISDSKGHCSCYAHLGQHGGCSWDYVMTRTVPAKEYSELQRELESIGYELNIVKRRNYDRYLKAYHEQISI